MTKYKLQEMPDVHNTGKRKVYPKIVTNRTLSRKEFIKRMQGYHRGISESTTEAVLLDVADMLVEMLSMGYNVNLEGIGTFSLSLGFEDDKPTEMQSAEDKMTYRKVGVKDINFKASPEFLKSVKHETDRDLERDMGGVKVIRKQLYSREERIARALEVIETNGLITLSDYAYINNLSRTASSLDLKEIADRFDGQRQPQGLGEEERINYMGFYTILLGFARNFLIFLQISILFLYVLLKV